MMLVQANSIRLNTRVPLVGWLKWNKYASRIADKHAAMIINVCRDSGGRIQFANKKMIGDYPILIAEILAIQKALETVVQEKLSNVIFESDSLIVVQDTIGEIKSPYQICNLVKDITALAEVGKNIKFLYCNSQPMLWQIAQQKGSSI